MRAPSAVPEAGALGFRGLAPAPRAPQPPACHLLLRRAASQSSEADERLVASADVEIGKLGGAIAGRVRKSGRVTVRSIGSKAAYRCIKAIVTATDYVRQDGGNSSSSALAVRLAEQVSTEDGDDGARRTVMIFEAELRDLPGPQSGSASRELIIGAQTNAGKAAAAIAAVMRQGKDAAALIRAMGANAVHQALISAALAQKYLNNDGDGVKFVVVPTFEDKNEPPKGVKPIKQLVLRVLRTEG